MLMGLSLHGTHSVRNGPTSAQQRSTDAFTDPSNAFAPQKGV